MNDNTARRGTLFVFSGPSGSGKDTILESFFKEPQEDIFLSISVTTRTPRPDETNGKDYYFLSTDEMKQLIDNRGNYYGTPKQIVEEQLSKGYDVILEIETKGAMGVREIMPHAVLIFLEPPSLEVLRQRLSKRSTETSAQVESRIEAAKRELALKDRYDYIIMNDTIEHAVKQLGVIIEDVRKKNNL